ncbi:Putative collagen-binding domain of a collagenase [Catalinimonas alkaloidigena]|uniref:Putative collagen-binding domain of a collagenase n=1 Tax=Catalinimonas alkaloidigena TaxID=1075417 RepID=A0A1G9BPU8_9BACT|nr:glycoside hydrolase family 140 protein [Catalinimonas alkaloidigena]SDK41174.1 Putative collagen-binding domain of a collagenase [Catalinimonas alkaloidigena]
MRLILLLACLFPVFGSVAQPQRLSVSKNQRFLVREDGTPFFWLGDTAWELFHRLDREQADRYLQRRAEQGFTVVQAVALAELDGLHAPNAYGDVPLRDDDPTQPLTTPGNAPDDTTQYDYWDHVDWMVDRAAALGLYVGLLPTWGDKVFKNSWGTGPEIFTPENARAYGAWIGRRYADRPNLIWIIGGDRNPRANADDLAIWRALAEGVEQGVGGRDKALLTFHPQPTEHGSSSNWFQQDAWLDFNMHQTGHCRDLPVYDRMQEDYALTPVKPTLNGEPIYEDHPVCFNAAENGYSYASDIRKAAYLSLFAGAFGHTYGCHNVWQMWAPGRTPVNGPLKPWYESLDLPGAVDLHHVRWLLESRPMLDRVPDPLLLASEPGSAAERVQATRGRDYAFVYSAAGRPFTVNMGLIRGRQVRATWYDPRTGRALPAETLPNRGTNAFVPPSAGLGQDWVLILDDVAQDYPLPQQQK